MRVRHKFAFCSIKQDIIRVNQFKRFFRILLNAPSCQGHQTRVKWKPDENASHQLNTKEKQMKNRWKGKICTKAKAFDFCNHLHPTETSFSCVFVGVREGNRRILVKGHPTRVGRKYNMAKDISYFHPVGSPKEWFWWQFDTTQKKQEQKYDRRRNLEQTQQHVWIFDWQMLIRKYSRIHI